MTDLSKNHERSLPLDDAKALIALFQKQNTEWMLAPQHDGVFNSWEEAMRYVTLNPDEPLAICPDVNDGSTSFELYKEGGIFRLADESMGGLSGSCSSIADVPVTIEQIFANSKAYGAAVKF